MATLEQSLANLLAPRAEEPREATNIGEAAIPSLTEVRAGGGALTAAVPPPAARGAARGRRLPQDATPDISDKLRRKGAARLLVDQAKQVKRAQKRAEAVIHGNVKSLPEPDFYPAHPPRQQTPGYVAIHKKLVHDMDLPCLVCGVRYSIVSDAAKQADPKLNPYGAARIETHHRIVEWALANAIDPEKFNNHLRPALDKRHPGGKYAQRFTDQQIKDWVDHDPDNLWVLCDVHHRHKFFGIHAISDPMWGPQDILLDDFTDAVRKAITDAGFTITREKPQARKAAKKTAKTSSARRRATKKRSGRKQRG